MASADYIKYGTNASIEEIRRNSRNAIYDIRNEKRNRDYATIGSLLSIGKSLWDNYSSNEKVIDYAKSRGFEVKTSKFAQIFGTDLEFDPTSETVAKITAANMNPDDYKFNKEFFLSQQMYDDYNKQKSMLDVLDSSPIDTMGAK